MEESKIIVVLAVHRFELGTLKKKNFNWARVLIVYKH